MAVNSGPCSESRSHGPFVSIWGLNPVGGLVAGHSICRSTVCMAGVSTVITSRRSSRVCPLCQAPRVAPSLISSGARVLQMSREMVCSICGRRRGPGLDPISGGISST